MPGEKDVALQGRQAAAHARFDARTAPRCPVTVTRASVRELGALPEAAELIDLSIYGCRLLAAGIDEVGARLWLRLNGGWPIAATAVWVKDGELGCRFDKPIDNALMRELTRG